jgi:hypothetical protein
MAFPSEIRAGDAVEWTDDLAPTASNFTYYFRTNAASGATAAGTLTNGIWAFTLSSATTTNFTPGAWFYQAISVSSGAPTTQRYGGFDVLRSLTYAGAATAIDLRSQAQIDLDAVEAAIRALASGAQEYRIGTATGGRLVKRAELSQLIAWRDRLKADVAREKIAENIANGKGDGRSLYIRFR